MEWTRDAWGNPVDVLWEDSPRAGVCKVPGCMHKTNTWGFVPYGGRIGYICADHRGDRAAVDAVISAKLGRKKAGE